jgi:hypothetical protein
MLSRSWKDLIYQRKECVQTTWTFRFIVVTVFGLLVLSTRDFWIEQVSDSLVCDEHPAAVDAIVIENLERSYLPFERAARLHQKGIASRVLIPVEMSNDPAEMSLEGNIVDLMIRAAGLEHAEQIRVRGEEPISLNVARQVRDVVVREKIGSVLVVSTGFRSARAMLVYRSVLENTGVSAFCEPVLDPHAGETWTDSWHGIQEVALQFLKLQYYRFYVLPFFRGADRPFR